MKVYIVSRCYGSDSDDDIVEKYGPPEAAFASTAEAYEYTGASGLAVTELELS